MDITCNQNRLVPLLVISLIFCGCKESQPNPTGDPVVVDRVVKPVAILPPGTIEHQPLVPPQANEGATRFEQIAPEMSGIEFVPPWDLPSNYAMHLTSYASTAGVAIGDYDLDGQPDVFFSSMKIGGKLYRNLGDFRFEDVTQQAGLELDGHWGTGVTWADIDNDGRLDLYLCGFDCPNRLYINRGDGTFTERAKEHGLDFSGASTTMAFADFDRDGDLDGYLLTNSLTNYGSVSAGKGEIIDGKVKLAPEFDEKVYVMYLPDGSFKLNPAGQFDHLFLNNGSGSFTEVSKETGIHGPNHHGLSATWWDYDGDMWPDLYVSNDFYGPDHLYRNNGDPQKTSFTNRVKDDVPHVPWYSMGTDFGDINNDGHFDFMGADMSASSHYRSKLTMGDMSPHSWFLDFADPPQQMRNMLLVNTGNGSFMEAAQLSKVANTDWTWSVRMADLDCDGWLDLFLTTGMTRDFMNTDTANQVDEIKKAVPATKDGTAQRNAQAAFWKNKPKMSERNLAFRNKGDLEFEDVGNAWGLGEINVGFGAATGDLDGDGDLDLVVNNYKSPPSVFRNHSGAGGSDNSNRVKISLVGGTSNSFGVGAHVSLESDSGQQVRYLTLSRGYMSSSEPALFFGLGSDDSIKKLTIKWPSGHEQEFSDLVVNQAYTVSEPDGDASLEPVEPSPSSKPSKTLLTELPAMEVVRHKEKRFDDFELQPLLPNRLSQLGPGLAWGDLDGDGKEDFVLSGSAGEATMVYFRRASGFKPIEQGENSPKHDKACEDLAPLLLDVDADGDLDLYVVSGGVEVKPDSPLLKDRLYLNDGKGQLVRAPEDALPDVRDSGSTAVAADYDHDGDLDLFVGGRVVPGKYPTVPYSRLLRNDTKPGSEVRFADATDDDSEGLSTTGMVTGAIWSDTNNDGWVDLVVTHEWGPVKVFRNRKGKLVDETKEAGLGDRLGWYNGIAGGDIDHDGDIDLVVTNFGRNTKYHPTPAAPTYIYYGDFEGSGKKNIVEASQKKEGLLPVRGKSCSQNAIPGLSKKFPTYDSFASKFLEEIYTPTCLSDAMELVANDLDSGVLINQGDGRFKFQSLPTLAQIAPGFGVGFSDLDCDGNLDIVMAQNFYGPQRETGRMDGGVGAVLRGDGDGGFSSLWPDESGLDIGADATALAWTDINGDGARDLVVGVNNGGLRAWLSSSKNQNASRLTVKLNGKAGNPTGVGARVSIDLDDGTTQSVEAYAGDGYLSQSSSQLIFALGQGRSAKGINVQWPDGQVSKKELGDQKLIELNQPE